jgi:pyridoxamine 5'-phosphate oxidase
MSLTKKPFKIFLEWFEEAKHSETQDPTIMSLATANKQGVPSVRIALLKAFDERGFVFYTNLQSRKAKELLENPYAAICFYWPTYDREIRIEGKVELVSDEQADDYFATRPRGRQLAAWASKQSQSMKDPEELFERVKKFEKKFQHRKIPRPEFWSGFRLVPSLIEFWKRGEHRLHQRICFYKTKRGWKMKYLYP